MMEEPKILYGLHQIKKSSDALKRLSRWKPEFRTGESIFQEATAKTPRGYTAQEEAAFGQKLSRNNMQQFRSATQANPNLAQNVQAGISYGNVAALTDFASADARLKRDNINRLASDIARQDNMNVQYQMQQKAQMEQAYGEAKRAGIANVFGAFDSKMNDLKTVASFLVPMAGAGAGGGGGQRSLGAMAAGSATPKFLMSSATAGKGAASGYNFGAAASAGNVVGDVPYNTNWKPYATPTEYNPFKP